MSAKVLPSKYVSGSSRETVAEFAVKKFQKNLLFDMFSMKIKFLYDGLAAIVINCCFVCRLVGLLVCGIILLRVIM